MTDKEILAELKLSYEKLYDIRENGCIDHCNGQLPNKLIEKLEIAKSNIEDIYSEFYRTLDKEKLRVKSLEKDNDEVYISSFVSGDYETNGYGLSCNDVDYYWYEDQDFLEYDELENIYYIKLWITENDRNQGFADTYYKDFNNLEEAIKDLRTYFYDGNCVCVEIYDENDRLYYACDKDSEDFYINNLKISKINQNLISKYIDEWVNKEELSINDDLVYCEENDELFVAIDNSTGECYTEEFKDEKDVFKWFLKEYEKDDLGMEF